MVRGMMEPGLESPFLAPRRVTALFRVTLQPSRSQGSPVTNRLFRSVHRAAVSELASSRL